MSHTVLVDLEKTVWDAFNLQQLEQTRQGFGSALKAPFSTPNPNRQLEPVANLLPLTRLRLE
jgi:hypothetical protein